MNALWAVMVPAAIAIALSPTGLIEMILLLLTKRARLNVTVFLVSVMVSVFLMPLLGASVLGAALENRLGAVTAGTLTGWLLIGFGALLLVVAVVAASRSPTDARPPAVFDRIAGMGPGAAFALSTTVVWFNPINALVLLSVGSKAAVSDVSTTWWLLSLAVFTVLATLPFIAVVAVLVWRGDQAGAALDGLNRWLIRHNRVLSVAVLGVLGPVLALQGWASLP